MKCIRISTIVTAVIAAVISGQHGRVADAQNPPALSINTSAILQRPSSSLPDNRLGLVSFNQPVVAGALLQTNQVFSQMDVVGEREFLESSGWYLECDASRGSVLAVRKPVNVVASPQNLNALSASAQLRLAGWGIPAQEIVRVLPRKLKRQDETNAGTSAASLRRYKVFVWRGINGVPIEGHRAVLTYQLDGSFHRALIQWPALAAVGHRLRCALSNDQIVQRVSAVLQSEGVTAGQIALRWKYLPTLQASGEVTLELVVAARLPAGDGSDDEAQEFNVPVSAY